jgi:hypothetical protein
MHRLMIDRDSFLKFGFVAGYSREILVIKGIVKSDLFISAVGN